MAGRKQATMTSPAAVALLVVALLAIVAVAPATPTGPYTKCGVNLLTMKDACEKYCARGSTEAWPGNGCCNVLRGADLPCLCGLKRKMGYMGNFDAARAMQIPSVCGIPGAPTSC